MKIPQISLFYVLKNREPVVELEVSSFAPGEVSVSKIVTYVN